MAFEFSVVNNGTGFPLLLLLVVVVVVVVVVAAAAGVFPGGIDVQQ